MFRFQDLKIHTKLAIAFIAVLLPLVVSSILTIRMFSKEVKEEAESELIETVTLLYRLCESMEEIEKKAEFIDKALFQPESI